MADSARHVVMCYPAGTLDSETPSPPAPRGPATDDRRTRYHRTARTPLHQLTTFELRDYRRRLETAIALASTRDFAVPVRAVLRARPGDVLAEQDDRARIAHA